MTYPGVLEDLRGDHDVVVLLGAGGRGLDRPSTARRDVSVLDDLIEVGAGRVSEHAVFGARTTYRVGGTVRALVTLSSPRDLEELVH